MSVTSLHKNNPESCAVPVHHHKNANPPMQHYFNQFWSNFTNLPGLFNMWRSNSFWPDSTFCMMGPVLDITENGKEYKIHAELPGMQEKDVDISINGRSLTLKGEKQEEREEKHDSTLLRERSYGSFQRVLPLPESIDTHRVTASFKDGLLTIKLPKKAKAAKEAPKSDVRQAA